MAGNENSRKQSLKTVEALARIDERLNNMESRLKTAHTRIDGIEAVIREDVKEIHKALLPLRDWMNRGKAGVAVLVIADSIIGGLVASIVSAFLSS